MNRNDTCCTICEVPGFFAYAVPWANGRPVATPEATDAINMPVCVRCYTHWKAWDATNPPRFARMPRPVRTGDLSPIAHS